MKSHIYREWEIKYIKPCLTLSTILENLTNYMWEILKGSIGDLEYSIGLELELGITPALIVDITNCVDIWSVL